jgi:hypothetical protein
MQEAIRVVTPRDTFKERVEQIGDNHRLLSTLAKRCESKGLDFAELIAENSTDEDKTAYLQINEFIHEMGYTLKLLSDSLARDEDFLNSHIGKYSTVKPDIRLAA